MAEIDITGIDKAELLVALYGSAYAQGFGILHDNATNLTIDEARNLLKQRTYFDYVNGRLLKVDLSGNTLNPWLYNRDNGEGAAEQIIERLRQKGGVNTSRYVRRCIPDFFYKNFFVLPYAQSSPMLIITSPAKQLDLNTDIPEAMTTVSCPLSAQTLQIAECLKQLSPKQLQSFYKSNETIALENYNRWQAWSEENHRAHGRASMYTYNGQVMKQLHRKEYRDAELTYAKQSLITLSALYGVLKTNDPILPYRLEMNSTLPSPIGSLAKFWKPNITNTINSIIQKENHHLVINLASNEYNQVIDIDTLQVPVISISFLQQKNGKTKAIAVHSKQARGMMINHLIRSHAVDLSDILSFAEAGYTLHKETPTTIEFIRSID